MVGPLLHPTRFEIINIRLINFSEPRPENRPKVMYRLKTALYFIPIPALWLVKSLDSFCHRTDIRRITMTRLT